jgi:hypothetical protein
MDMEEIIRKARANRSLPTDDDLKRLRQMGMFPYVRLSCEAQVRERRESIRDITRTGRKKEKDRRPGRRSKDADKGGPG